jgi:cytochrome o ubiquinol oxidase subunit 2
MAQQNKNRGPARPILLTFLGLLGLGLLIAWLLRGTDIFLFNPKGHIAHEELKLMLLSAAILLCIGVPTLAVLYFVAWKYRDSNTEAPRDLRATRGKWFMFTVWASAGSGSGKSG